jgi:F0F1-type ATP synthase delta subunit
LIEFKLLKSFIDSREFFLKKLRVVLGRIKIEVTTIDTSQHAKLELIRQNLQSIWGQNIEINFIEDSNIIGGLLLQVEDKFFDGSLNGKITELKNLNFKGEL